MPKDAIEEDGEALGEPRESGAQAALISGADSSSIDLERLVSQPTWRDVLLDLVVKEELDPWNIDLVLISDKYLQRLKSMHELDLRVPANIILAAAILLRFKSEALRLEDQETMIESETFLEDERPAVEIPMLSMRTRIPPKRRVTLPELISALEKVLEKQKHSEEATVLISPAEPLVIELPGKKLEEQLEEMVGRLDQLKDSEGVVLFSALLKEKTTLEIIGALIPLLYLTQDGKVSLVQEPLFAEIFIHVLSSSHGKRKHAVKPADAG